MVMIPPYVPEAFLTMYLPAIYAGLIVGFIGTMAIAMKREEIHILILTGWSCNDFCCICGWN